MHVDESAISGKSSILLVFHLKLVVGSLMEMMTYIFRRWDSSLWLAEKREAALSLEKHVHAHYVLTEARLGTATAPFLKIVRSVGSA